MYAYGGWNEPYPPQTLVSEHWFLPWGAILEWRGDMGPWGGGILLEVCHWGELWDFIASPNSYLPCFLSEDENVISQLPPPASTLAFCYGLPAITDYSSGTEGQEKPFLLKVPFLLVFYHSSRNVINTRYLKHKNIWTVPDVVARAFNPSIWGGAEASGHLWVQHSC